MGLIYEIINKNSGKRYVGMTIHETLAGRYRKGDWIRDTCNGELRRDAQRLGEAAFDVRTEVVADNDLRKRESSLIRLYKENHVPLYNGTRAYPSFGDKRGQRQKLIAYVREQ